MLPLFVRKGNSGSWAGFRVIMRHQEEALSSASIKY